MDRTIRAVRWPLYGAFVIVSAVAVLLALPAGLETLAFRSMTSRSGR